MIFCANPTCEKPLAQPTVLYDDHADLTFCSGGCQHDWADDNFERVLAFYNRMNVTRIGAE
jgi:hypothetical protein